MSNKLSQKGGRESHFVCLFKRGAFLAPRVSHGAVGRLQGPGAFSCIFYDFNKTRESRRKVFCNEDKRNREKQTFQEEVRETLCTSNKRQLLPQQSAPARTHTHTLAPIQQYNPSAVAGLGEPLWIGSLRNHRKSWSVFNQMSIGKVLRSFHKNLKPPKR